MSLYDGRQSITLPTRTIMSVMETSAHVDLHSSPAQACGMCRNEAGNKQYYVREMMFGTKVEFPYQECYACGCLQLMLPPSDIASYYPRNYYAFQSPSRWTSLRKFLRGLKNRSYFGKASSLAFLWDQRHPYSQLESLARLKPMRDARILDVGCGSGSFVLDLSSMGFKNVLGVDPFIARDIEHRGRVLVKKCSLDDLRDDAWDVIMFHHSFEHMSDQHDTLRVVRGLLAPRGTCLIRIPVTSWAWKRYGVNWVQIDAPRHFFLHTERSLGMLAEQSGLAVTGVHYDSTEFQFWGSELYARGVSFGSHESTAYFSRRAVNDFRGRARRLNEQRMGDQAAFYLETC
jgi:SAM-dependent methyltransferase